MTWVMPNRTKPEDPWDAISTSHLLHRAQQLASDRFSFLIGEDSENNVTLRQYVILTAIAETPGVNQAALTRATGVDRSTLADLLQRLEDSGLVMRKDSESDGRANTLELTEDGKTTLVKTREYARAADAAILDALPPSKRRSFQNMLLRLSARADKLARDAEREAKRQAKREAKQRAKERKKAKAQAKKEAEAAAEREPSNDNPSSKRKPRRKSSGR